MAQPQPKPSLSPEEYLAIDRQAEIRSEYLDGEMFAMAGGSRAHNLIVTNIVRELSLHLKKRPCEVYSGDQRVRIPEIDYTYPDVVVACGEPRFEDEHLDTLLNPVLIVEVLSPTTEAYDRGKKFQLSQEIESLAEYVLVAQDQHRVERFLRQDGNEWLLTTITGLESTVSLTSIQCALPLAEVYDKVEIGGAG
jgi:Uma2 family endonuclease